ncbi:hypothetical protein FQZ97_641890 [compost metagenome]
MTYQTYTIYNTGVIWTRAKYNSAWSAWRQLAALDSPAFTGTPSAPTAALGDDSTKLATTAFVQATFRDVTIGQIIMEVRTSARAGCLKLNGALLNRADYPLLWAYAQASGALVTEAVWSANSWGCFSTGDGSTTFRIPDLRGESPRFWDDGRGVDASRGIGTFQNFQNATHTHTASTDAAGNHTHSTWTDAQGHHGHGVNDPGHGHAFFGRVADGHFGYAGGGGINGVGTPMREWTNTNGSGTGIWLNGDGSHGHNIGMNGAGSHTHTVTVNSSGGAEARVRNVALLAMIRAF